MLLGRWPESAQVAEEMIGAVIETMPTGFLRSDEFYANIYEPIVEQRAVHANLFQGDFDTKFVSWVIDRLSFGDEAVAAGVEAASSWPELILAIHEGGRLIRLFGDERLTRQADDFAEGLQHLLSHTGLIISSVGADEQARPGEIGPGAGRRPSRDFYTVHASDIEQIRASGLFDAEYYCDHVPVLPDDMDPLEHYLSVGARNYVSPGPQFDAIGYLAETPSARDASTSPLIHYVRTSKEAGPFKPKPRGTWVGDVGYTDNDVHLERLHAADFFYRYNLGAAGELALRHAAAAVAELSGRDPCVELDKPQVSIIIPVYGQLPFVLHCLDALAGHVSRYSFEIMVFDDASPVDDGVGQLAAIPWVRYVHGGENRGFIGACNHAVSLSSADYVVLLNSDTRVCQGWLDELIGTFENFPQAGLVGSKLYNADGSLQEAGAIVWADGSAWNYGRNDNPTLPQYSYARETDYSSGAAIAIPRLLWNDLGGFDTHYLPAYYEDVDLAFRIRAAGREVWFQPLARVIHYEGVTHGRDETKGIKASQVINAAKFHERWKATIRDFGRNGHQPLKASNRKLKRRMLALDAVTPTPDRDAGSVMTVKLFELYRKLGWHVSFAPVHDPRFTAKYAADMQRLGIEVLRPDQGSRVENYLIDREQYYEVVLGFRVTVLGALVGRIRQLCPAALILFHDIDLHYLRQRREAALLDSRYLERMADITENEELALVSAVDCSIVPSSVERAILCDRLGVENVVVYSYTADAHRTEPHVDTRKHIVFVGGFRHTPNVDAMEFFIAEVWPELSRRLPADANFYVVGDEAPANLKALASDRVIFTGFLEDLAPTLETCRVFVAPLRYGAGLKGKVVTSLSYGVPCVGSSIAIEGMGLTPGGNLVEANSAAEFIEEVTALYGDMPRWHRLREAGYAFVEEEYGWKAGLKVAQEILDVAERTWTARCRQAREARIAAFRREREPIE